MASALFTSSTLRHVELIGVHDLCLGQNISEPEPTVVSEDKQAFKAQDGEREQPTDVRKLIKKKDQCDRQIADDRLAKRGGLAAPQAPRLKSHQPLPEASSPRQSIGRQQVGQTSKKPDRRNRLVDRDRNQEIRTSSQPTVDDVSFRVDFGQWMASRPFFLEDSVTLQLDRQYNKSLRPSQTNDWIFQAGSA